jgi:hypothetical protein
MLSCLLLPENCLLSLPISPTRFFWSPTSPLVSELATDPCLSTGTNPWLAAAKAPAACVAGAALPTLLLVSITLPGSANFTCTALPLCEELPPTAACAGIWSDVPLMKWPVLLLLLPPGCPAGLLARPVTTPCCWCCGLWPACPVKQALNCALTWGLLALLLAALWGDWGVPTERCAGGPILHSPLLRSAAACADPASR